MRTLIFYLFTALVSFFMAYIIFNNKEKPIPKILTIDTTYTYLAEENQKMEVSLYINHKHHPLNDKQSYQFLYLSDQDETKKLEVELLDIKKNHYENYLNETYQQVTLLVKLPYITGNIDILNAYINITLTNQETYSFFIGKFFYTYMYMDGDFLDWTGLQGLKAENQFISRLQTIVIPFHTLSKDIREVSVGSHDRITYEIKDQKLHLYIDYDAHLLFHVPIIITYTDSSIQTISNFRYFIDYQTLKESGPLVNMYALN